MNITDELQKELIPKKLENRKWNIRLFQEYVKYFHESFDKLYVFFDEICPGLLVLNLKQIAIYFFQHMWSYLTAVNYNFKIYLTRESYRVFTGSVMKNLSVEIQHHLEESGIALH